MKNNLITINKNNEIETTLLEVEVNNILTKIKEVRNFAVYDQDTKVEAKELQRNLLQGFKELDDLRKDKQRQYTEPFKTLQKQFKYWDNEIKTELEVLSNNINSFEKEQLNAKTKELEEYFTNNNNIDFLTFDKMNINVTLSASFNSLTKQVDDFIDGVNNDLSVIQTQENKERILIRYQNDYNLSNAINSVNEEIKKEQELLKDANEDEVLEEVIKTKEIIETKTKEEKNKIMLFVDCTNSQLNNLKIFMNENNIDYKI